MAKNDMRKMKKYRVYYRIHNGFYSLDSTKEPRVLEKGLQELAKMSFSISTTILAHKRFICAKDLTVTRVEHNGVEVEEAIWEPIFESVKMREFKRLEKKIQEEKEKAEKKAEQKRHEKIERLVSKHFTLQTGSIVGKKGQFLVYGNWYTPTDHHALESLLDEVTK